VIRRFESCKTENNIPKNSSSLFNSLHGEGLLVEEVVADTGTAVCSDAGSIYTGYLVVAIFYGTKPRYYYLALLASHSCAFCFPIHRRESQRKKPDN
jgi:hypothetical protein